MYYLGVDMGTSFTKGTLVDEEGRVALRVRRESSVSNPQEGFFEVDAEKVWWKNFLWVCERVLSEFPASSIRALCVSSVCGSFVPVDEGFRPVHNAVLYGIDRRSESLVGVLNARYGEEFLQKRLGNAFSTHSVLPKILWLKMNRPEVYSRAVHFLSSFNFISARLTGVPAWDIPTAYGALMLDGETEAVPQWFLEDQGLDAKKIPPVISPLQTLGPVTRKAAEETGLSPGTEVVLGACDINAEAMAVGAIRPGSAVSVFGSTVSLLLNTSEPHSLKGFMTGRSLLPGVWRIGAATASGGRTISWGLSLRQDGQGRQNGSSLLAADNVPTGRAPTGIFFVPYLDGARTPFNEPTARGAFFGLTSAHTPAHMAAAVEESLGYELAHIISLMEKSLTEESRVTKSAFPSRLEVSGGLSRVGSLMQSVADITGRSLRLHPEVDASFGDALIAMTAHVPWEDLPSPDRALPVIQPSEFAASYGEFSRRFAALCENVARLG
ncbi:MAG: hypothetical protein LBP21_04120 [Synergistaceae bacterium]|jgi:xylulokinase|nr:hypothetical protein [Synergistaceae bacterium]